MKGLLFRESLRNVSPMFRALFLISALLLNGSAFSFERGCACRGGPGFRLTNGKCASWKQHESYMNKGGYPAGTTDERGASCTSKAEPLKVRPDPKEKQPE